MFTNVRLNNIALSFRSSSVLYSGFTVVILTSVNITESISHLCVYLRKLQKKKKYSMTLYLEHLVPSWGLFLSSQRKRARVSLHQSSSSMLESWLCWSFVYLPVTFISLESYMLCLWVGTCCHCYHGSVLRGKWRAWWRESVSHFLPNKKS